MSTILANELITTLEQDFSFNLNTRCHIGGFYPYLVMYNSPVGTFKIELLKGLSVIFEKEFTSSDIKTALVTSNNYAIVFYPILPDNPIQIENGNYTIKLSSAGYTYSATSYLAWIQQHENVQNIMAYTPVYDSENSLAFRIKELKEGVLCEF